MAGTADREEVSGQVSHEKVCSQGTKTDRFTGAVREREKGRGKIRNGVQPLGKDCEHGQDSYQGSREPAGQAGRREDRRHSYSPW